MEAALDVARRFGENLLCARRRAGLSQEAVSVRASLHRTEVGMLERGARCPRIDTLVKLATAVSASPAELLDGLIWNPGESARGAFQIGAYEEPES